MPSFYNASNGYFDLPVRPGAHSYSRPSLQVDPFNASSSSDHYSSSRDQPYRYRTPSGSDASIIGVPPYSPTAHLPAGGVHIPPVSPDASALPMPTMLTPPNMSARSAAPTSAPAAPSPTNLTNTAIQSGKSLKEAAFNALGPEGQVMGQLSNAALSAIDAGFNNEATAASREAYNHDINMRTPGSNIVASRRLADSDVAANRSSTFRNVGGLFGGPLGSLAGQWLSNLTAKPPPSYNVLATPTGRVDPTRMHGTDSENSQSYQ